MSGDLDHTIWHCPDPIGPLGGWNNHMMWLSFASEKPSTLVSYQQRHLPLRDAAGSCEYRYYIPCLLKVLVTQKGVLHDEQGPVWS